MSFRITDHCTGCTACSKICPVQAITGSKNEIHVIHETNCIECGTCGRICPASSVVDSFGSQTLRIKRSLWEKPVFDYKTCMACVICVESCPSGVIGLKKINKKLQELLDSDVYLNTSLSPTRMKRGLIGTHHSDDFQFLNIIEANKNLKEEEEFELVRNNIAGLIMYFNDFEGGELH